MIYLRVENIQLRMRGARPPIVDLASSCAFTRLKFDYWDKPWPYQKRNSQNSRRAWLFVQHFTHPRMVFLSATDIILQHTTYHIQQTWLFVDGSGLLLSQNGLPCIICSNNIGLYQAYPTFLNPTFPHTPDDERPPKIPIVRVFGATDTG